MKEIKLETKQRITALLRDEDLQASSVFGEIEALVRSPNANNFCSELLKFFVHASFDEDEAQQHWQKIFENYDYFAKRLDHDAGLRVAIFDYFVNLNKSISSPIVVEMQVFKETEKLALVDALTGLFNRRYFDVSLKKELKRAVRYDKRVSVALIDLDNFKRLNDSLGHQFGDQVLKRLGAILRSISREEDIPCRYGGEEFVVVLPETHADGAVTFAARLRSEMKSDPLLAEHGVTFSGGIAAFPDNAETAAELLEIADKALYAAKYAGKDRCQVG